MPYNIIWVSILTVGHNWLRTNKEIYKWTAIPQKLLKYSHFLNRTVENSSAIAT